MPVTVFAGYLGSGKTTIIANAIAAYPSPPRFALIKNEYGDASIDGTLLQFNNLAVKDILNGCLCCVLVGAINPAVNELIERYQPERIIIEASGAAHPFPIILELKKNSKVYLDGVIQVVDVVNFTGIMDKSYVGRDMARSTDLILFNKTGSVSPDQLYRVKEDVFDLNPDTPSIDTDDGFVDPQILFGTGHKDISTDALPEKHHHDLETYVVSLERPIMKERVTQVLAACDAHTFFRIKGILLASDRKWYLVNGVFGKIEWREIKGSQQMKSQLIFIGSGIKKFETQIRDYLVHAQISES